MCPNNDIHPGMAECECVRVCVCEEVMLKRFELPTRCPPNSSIEALKSCKHLSNLLNIV